MWLRIVAGVTALVTPMKPALSLRDDGSIPNLLGHGDTNAIDASMWDMLDAFVYRLRGPPLRNVTILPSFL